MAIQEINKGTGPNTGTGTPARTAADMINANFAYLDSKVGTKELLVENNAVTGTYAIDWTKDTYYLTLTGNTTFSQINLPPTGVNTKELKIYLTGNYVPTFPAGWATNKVGTYKGTEVNEISIKYIKSGVYFVKFENSLTQYPAPILGEILPISLLPSSTAELRLKGAFFTPAGFVLINGQTVNSIEFDANTGDYILSVTTGALEGNFDIVISNGTTVTFAGRFVVNLGTVYVPTFESWTNITEPIDVNSVSQVKLKTAYQIGSARWDQVLDTSKDFEVRFKLAASPLVADFPAFNSSVNYNAPSFEIRKASDDSLVFYGKLQGNNYIDLFNSGSSSVLVTRIGANSSEPFFTGAVANTFSVKYINGIMYMARNNTTFYTNPLDQNLAVNLYIVFKVKGHDFVNIQYIELP